MFARMELTVSPQDGSPFKVTVDQRDYAAFEREYAMSFVDGLRERPNAAVRFWAFSQQRRTKATAKGFAEWDDATIQVDIVSEDADDVDPGDPTA